LFLGEHRHSLDAKGRVIFPTRYRDELGTQVVVQKGTEPCLVVWPVAEWQEVEQKVRSLPTTTDPKARRFARYFFSQASNERVDGQGRLTIPQALREYADLSREVVIVGNGPRLEIWDAGRWGEHVSEVEGHVDEFSEQLGI
jgi:MraZ protein